MRSAPLTTSIEIRSTAEEKAAWQELAKGQGVTLSDLIRSLLKAEPPPRKRRASKQIDPDLLRELARIGNNLNQIAHHANGHRPPTATALLVRLIEIDRELSALRRAASAGKGRADAD